MPRTPDRQPGVSDEEGIDLESTGVATSAGQVRYTGTRFSLYDDVGEYDPRSGGGLNLAQHRAADQLVHLIAEDSEEEFNYTGNQITSIITWNVGKTLKIREELFTYTGTKIDTIVTKHYDGAGTVITGETMTETYTYTGNKVTAIDRVLS